MNRNASYFLTALLFLAYPVVSYGDLVTNGDFATSVPSNASGAGWTSSTIDFAGGWRSTGGNPDESFILNSGSTPVPEPTIEQTVSGLTPGQQYELSWDYQLHVFSSGSSGDSFGVFIDDPTISANHLFVGGNPTSDWVTESVIFTATSASHTFSFVAELSDPAKGSSAASDVSYRLDNVSLVSAVPEPSSTILFVVAAMLGCRMRRRNKR